MELTEIRDVVRGALLAAMNNDDDGVYQHVGKLFEPDAGPGDCLVFVLSLIEMDARLHGVEHMREHNQDMFAVPRVARMDPDGTLVPTELSEAPLGISTYIRLKAAWINQDADITHALWQVLVDMVQSDDPVLFERGSEAITQCMAQALHDTSVAVLHSTRNAN